MVEAQIQDAIQEESEKGLIPPTKMETSYKDSDTEVFILQPRRALSVSRDTDDAWGGERAIYERELDELRENLYRKTFLKESINR